MVRLAPAGGDDKDTPGTGASDRAEARRLFIEQSAVAVGQTWARHFRKDLHREGRPASGGWPGTVREARSRVQQMLLLELRCRRMHAISEVERELAARIAYASARDEWRRHADPEGV